MRVRLGNNAPLPFAGPMLVDSSGIPRFWASVWTAFQPKGLAAATVDKRLFGVEALYAYTEDCVGDGALDDAIAALNVHRLSDILEGFYLSIKNSRQVTTASEIKWQSALQFVLDSVRRLDRASARWETLTQLLSHFQLLHSHLHVFKQRRPERLRSLPADVVEGLYEILDPDNSKNPFRAGPSRWRVWVVFVLLLHQGLRRGELLSLPTDVIKSGRDRRTQDQKCWMTVRYNEYEDETRDPRYSAPSIKNAQSIRQIPVSETITSLVDVYVGSYRGKPSHTFLVNSQKNTPLSHEGLSWLFRKITSSLPGALRRSLRDHCASEDVTPHNLRHTCAVMRLNQMLSAGADMKDALERMRVLFGWSRSSEEPLRYARAVFEDRLGAVWNSKFDERVEVLRNVSTGAE